MGHLSIVCAKMKYRTAFLFLACFGFCHLVQAQNFAERCEGTWSGMMQLHAKGINYDSIAVKLFVERTDQPNTWTWRKEYYAADTTRIKDYKMLYKDTTKNIYIIDEGDGIELQQYLFKNKLYGVFETEGLVLTSNYELLSDKELQFEVTSGQKVTPDLEVNNYSVDYLQRILFIKED